MNSCHQGMLERLDWRGDQMWKYFLSLPVTVQCVSSISRERNDRVPPQSSPQCPPQCPWCPPRCAGSSPPVQGAVQPPSCLGGHLDWSQGRSSGQAITISLLWIIKIVLQISIVDNSVASYGHCVLKLEKSQKVESFILRNNRYSFAVKVYQDFIQLWGKHRKIVTLRWLLAI